VNQTKAFGLTALFFVSVQSSLAGGYLREYLTAGPHLKKQLSVSIWSVQDRSYVGTIWNILEDGGYTIAPFIDKTVKPARKAGTLKAKDIEKLAGIMAHDSFLDIYPRLNGWADRPDTFVTVSFGDRAVTLGGRGEISIEQEESDHRKRLESIVEKVQHVLESAGEH